MIGKITERRGANGAILLFKNQFVVVPVLLFLGGCAWFRALFLYATSPDDRWGFMFGGLLFSLAGLFFFEIERFIFDGRNRTISWKMYRLTRRRSPGTISFDDVKEVTLERFEDAKGGDTFRIILNCKNFDLPLVTAATPGRAIHEQMRSRIASFVLDSN